MAYRAFFALPADNFATSTGQPTNAVYGFTSMLINLLRDETPTHIAVAFDVGRTTFRTEQFPEYKGTRAETPEEFRGQVPLIKEVLDALNVAWLEKPNFEADDIMATLSLRGEEAGFDVLVCSGDRDTLQLVTETTTVLYPVKGVSELARFTPESVMAKYGVAPENYPGIAALVGETSDNLPGVPGVGPKTAAKWITMYGDLEGVIDNVDKIGGKVGDSLREHLAQVKVNRKLNRLVRDLELELTIADLARQSYSRESVHAVFDALQFRTLRERLFQAIPQGQEETEAAVAFEVTGTRAGAGDVGAWVAAHKDALVGVDVAGSYSQGQGDAWQLTLAAASDASVGSGAALTIDLTALAPEDEAALAAWLADDDSPKAFHDAKFALHAMESRGLAVGGVAFDTMLAAYLCHPDQRTYGLDDLCLRHLGRELTAADTGGGQGELILDEADDDAASWSRALAIVDLAVELGSELDARAGRKLLVDLELPLVRTLKGMESDGIAADRPYLESLAGDFGASVADAAAQAYAVIGHEVNLGSPKQLQEVLFEELGMPKTKKIKTGYTTDAESLADLFARTQHPFLEQLLRHRDVSKLKQTVDLLLRSIADDGRIHTTYQQTIAATGRLSSTDPNLQNIPIRTDEGSRIREAFICGEGYETLLTADYSQIEMRIMAHLSKDEGLIEAFKSGEDLHRFVGSRVFGVEPVDVTSAMRSKIKAMSYGLAYGLSAFGLSRQLNVETAEARNLMDDYFNRFGGVRDYLRSVVDEARVTGYTETILGRRRYLPDLNSDHKQRRDLSERVALNSPIQGSAADIIKLAMIDVSRRLAAAGAKSRLLLQIHDELLIEVAPGELESVRELVSDAMDTAVELSVPLEVSVGVGRSWRDAGH